MAIVDAVCISEKKGVRKHPVESIELVLDHGVAGDAHAGSHRQVSLLALEDMKLMQAKLATISAGDFAENLLVDGLSGLELKVGDTIRVGRTAVLEITQIGKECHSDCEIRKLVGTCIMPKRGLFGKVLAAGAVRAGDLVERTAS
jgi:MOSC domain-containing protein YiiM